MGTFLTSLDTGDHFQVDKVCAGRQTSPLSLVPTREPLLASLLGTLLGTTMGLTANLGRENELESKNSRCRQMRCPRVEEGDLRIQFRLPSLHCPGKFGERFSALLPL